MHTIQNGREIAQSIGGLKASADRLRIALIFPAVVLIAACGGGGEGSQTPPQTYTVGGSVSGLSGAGLQLQNGSEASLSVSNNGQFTFPTPVNSGAAYSVSIVAQPANPAQTCTVSNGTGTIGSSNVTSVAVSCLTNTYKLGGTVSGLAGTGLVLETQGSASLTVSGNGTFAFASPLQSGTAYSISITSQPTNPSQTCSVSSGSGTVGSADIGNVTISCATVITLNNAEAVTALGNASSETVMQLASFVGERLTYLSSHLAASVTETCSDPYHQFTSGQAVYSFSDNDGSGSLTPGDTVTITLTGCLSQSMADHVSGTATLSLMAPSKPSAGGTVFAATVTLNPISLIGLQVTGSLTLEYSALETQQTISASVGSSPLQLSYVPNGWFQPDTVSLTNVAVSKAIDYTIPQYSVQVASTFQSQNLKGQFSITTPTPLTGRLGIYPDAGMEVFRGGPSALDYAAQNVASNEWVSASLDQAGTGSFVSLDQQGLFWEQGFNGFAWWEPRGFSIVSTGSRPSYSTAMLNAWQMMVLYTEPQEADPINQILSKGMDVGTPIKFFFSGPVDASSASMVFAPAVYISGQSSIPAVLAVNGPIVAVTPQTQLQQGEQYTLQSPNPIATTWSAGGVGASVSLQLNTLNNLQANAVPSPAVAAPGQTVQLLTTGSFSSNSAITGYSWTQTGGATVALNAANTDAASFVVPPGAHSGDSFHFNLTITDGNGETDTVPVTAFVLTDLTQPFVYYRQQQTPTVGQTPEVAVLESPASGTVSTELGGTPNIFQFNFSGSSGTPHGDLLQFFPGNGIIAPGTYTSANTPGGQPFFLLSFPGCLYGAPTWTFTIYEAQAAPDGTAAQFSADFTESCPVGAPTPLSGSVRINSSKPLP